MKKQINHTSLFGLPLYQTRLDGFDQVQRQLKHHFLQLKEEDAGLSRSNHGGWHSSDDLFKSTNPQVQWLIKQIFKLAQEVIKHAEGGSVTDEIIMPACWANINEKGDWNAPHAHHPADWSGVCYINVKESAARSGPAAKDGDLMFLNPLPLGPDSRRTPTISFSPNAGHVVLFPGYMLHMVAPHYEEDPRISVAFNFRFRPKP